MTATVLCSWLESRINKIIPIIFEILLPLLSAQSVVTLLVLR